MPLHLLPSSQTAFSSFVPLQLSSTPSHVASVVDSFAPDMHGVTTPAVHELGVLYVLQYPTPQVVSAKYPSSV